MVELDNLKMKLSAYEGPMKELESSLDLENKQNRAIELEREMEAPDFWNDAEASSKKTKELKSLKDDIAVLKELKQTYEDIEAFIELGNEEEDQDIANEAIETFETFEKTFDNIRMKTLLSGEHDACNAVVTLHSGAGGTEACDWTAMLYRMYKRWAESRGFTVEELDFLEGDEAGIKSVTFQVDGENAYGYLK
ncbi:MAG: PCRF domain-containing protein, partial [Lachnospiraceae bacterium]|nr:PCRF domain-containing protein [Lachnospiraceae bacterium]